MHQSQQQHHAQSLQLSDMSIITAQSIQKAVSGSLNTILPFIVAQQLISCSSILYGKINGFPQNSDPNEILNKIHPDSEIKSVQSQLQKQQPISFQQQTHISQTLNKAIFQQDHRYDKYIQLLKQHGLVVSPKLQCSYSSLHNNLKYPSMIALQQIKRNQVLIQLPTSLLMTANKARQQYKQLQEIYNNQQFYHITKDNQQLQNQQQWQDDHILITYILYVLQKYPNENIWAIMASNFPKQIDILPFWSNEDLIEFKDKSIKNAATLAVQNFNAQWKDFTKIQEKYQILRGNTFTIQNYKWIYTHVVSRCFGAYLDSTYFVPFCEFFNHNCVEVSYQCINKQKQEKCKKQNIEIPLQDFDDETISSISECSGDSCDYIQENDYDYEQIPTYAISWCSKISYNLNEKQQQKIQLKFKQIMTHLQKNLIWRGFTLKYIGEIMQKSNIIKNQYMAERKKYQDTIEQLDIILKHINVYGKIVEKYYKQHGGGVQYKKKNIQVGLGEKSSKTTTTLATKQKEVNNDNNKYTHFQLKTDNLYQSTQIGEQIYFEYGRLSNRTLLLRYGFVLQDNQYQHVWIRNQKDIQKCLAEYPDLLNIIYQKSLPVAWNIKLKPYVLSTQLITLKKLLSWKLYGRIKSININQFFTITDIDKQISVIQEVIEAYKQEIPKYIIYRDSSLQDNNNNNNKYSKYIDLTDSNLSYHQYFIKLYHRQKLRILQLQTQLLQAVVKMLQEIEGIKKNKQKGGQEDKSMFWRIFKENFKDQKKRKMVYHYVKGLKNYI